MILQLAHGNLQDPKNLIIQDRPIFMAIHKADLQAFSVAIQPKDRITRCPR